MHAIKPFTKVLTGLSFIALALGLALSPAIAYAATRGSSGGRAASGVKADTGYLLVTIYDGTQKPMTAGTQVLIRVFDGRQKEIVSGFYKGPVVRFVGLPIHDNGDDNYRVVASAKDFNTYGTFPVHISAGQTASARIMLLPKHGDLVFEPWSVLRSDYPWLADLLAHGAGSEEAARERYERLMQEDPGALAALLNITTAGHQIAVDDGNFLSYFKEVVWQGERQEWREHRMVGFNPTNDTEHTMRHDRFWAYADRRLIDQVKRGVAEGRFFVETFSQVFHGGASGSYKEATMEEGHIHVSFYENDTRVIDGVECVLLEIHLDLYKDLLAHGILEVVPNTLLSQVTEPEDAYQKRWISSVNSGHGFFSPPFSIVPCPARKGKLHYARIK